MSKLLKLNEIGKRLQEHLSNKGINKLQFARSINEDPEYISCLLEGKDYMVPAENKRRIFRILGTKTWSIVQTDNFKIVQDICKLSKANAMLMAVIGSPGFGKTTALEHYSKSNKDVIYVRYEISMRTKDLFIAMLNDIGVTCHRPLHGTIEKLVDQISRRKKPLIIVDECDKMPYQVFQYLHILRNKTMNICGLILSGVPEMKRMLYQQASRKKQGIEEFLSRVQHWEELIRPLRSEIKAVCEHNDILDPDFIKELCKAFDYREVYNKVQLSTLQTLSLCHDQNFN